jgi:Ca2+:H+ antiporter
MAAQHTPGRWPPPRFRRIDLVVFAASGAGIVLSALAHFRPAGAVPTFVVTAVTVAALAVMVGRCVDQLAEWFGPNVTGVLHSALGNLPELFIGVFALKAGLTGVVQAAIIGSIIGNALLVLGLAFLVGGIRHGTQQFSASLARDTVALLLVAVAALLVPSLASRLHTPVAGHEDALSVTASVVLLVVFVLSMIPSLREPPPVGRVHPRERRHGGQVGVWSLPVALLLLAASSAGAALVANWFVSALQPAIQRIGFSQMFAGLVIVALVGNAVENVVGVQLAARNRADYALSVIVNSPLQVALVLAPTLVLLSHALSGPVLTLVFSPMLVVAVSITVIALAVIILDGESVWLEGAALLGLYTVIAASFWWG